MLKLIGAIFILAVIFLILAYVGFDSFTEFKSFVFSKVFYPTFSGGAIPDFSIVKVLPLVVIVFAAIGLFKNPSSHRYIDYDNPIAVSEIISFGNYLLRIISELGSTRNPDDE